MNQLLSKWGEGEGEEKEGVYDRVVYIVKKSINIF